MSVERWQYLPLFMKFHVPEDVRGKTHRTKTRIFIDNEK